MKGEFVVIVKKSKDAQVHGDLDKDLETLLNMGISKTDASKILAKVHGLKKNDVYRNAISKD